MGSSSSRRAVAVSVDGSVVAYGSVADRVSAAGYAWSTVAENIAAGQPSVTRVVDAWMNSDGHCANLMNATVRDVAVACVVNTTNQSNYWVMNLAKAR